MHIKFTKTQRDRGDTWTFEFVSNKVWGTGYWDGEEARYTDATSKPGFDFDGLNSLLTVAWKERHGMASLDPVKLKHCTGSRTIEYEGYKYILVGGRMKTQYLRMSVADNHIPLFNVNSRTFRAVHEDTLVRLSYPKPIKAETDMTPLEIELRKDEESLAQVRRVDSELSGIDELEQFDHVTKQILTPLASHVLEERGFVLEEFHEDVPTGVFYPPTEREHTGTKLSWDAVQIQL